MKCQINLERIGSSPKCESKCSNVCLQLIQSSALDWPWPLKTLFATLSFAIPMLLTKN